MSGSRPGIRASGFGLALLAFLLTRLLVAETATTATGTFVSAALIPLSAGLGLTIYGVALAVGAVSRTYARTVWRSSALGTLAMLVVLVATTLHVVLLGERIDTMWERSGTLVANLLLSGAVLGALVGDRTARHRKTNERLVQYAERTMLVNRRLRHEVRNVAAIVEGYASAGQDAAEDAAEAIEESTGRIERTVQHASEFADTTGEIVAVDVGEAVESVLAELPEGVDVRVEGSLPEGALVRADDRLSLLVAELLENAIEHTGPDATVTLEVETTAGSVDLVVQDDGPGLPEHAERVLAARSLPDHDDPTLGYGLQMVRLLVEQYDGTIQTIRNGGTEVRVTLQRTRARSTPALGLGVPPVDLVRAGAAAIVAAVVMALPMNEVAGVVPTIGALYGIENQLVGWTTHLFHSVVFGLLFAAGCRIPRVSEIGESLEGSVVLGVAWGLLLWLVAAAVVMPVGLAAVGVNAAIPTLSPVWFAGHLVWGAVLGWLYVILPGAELWPE
jgi:two-component system OmpR family sensor kinase